MHRQAIGHYDQIGDHVATAVGAAAAGGETCLCHVPEIAVGEIRLFRDQPYVTCEGALSEQGPLRTLEHFDVRKVNHPWIDRLRHRSIVDVETGCARCTEQALPRDSPDGYGPRGGNCRSASAVNEGEVGCLG